MMTVLLFQTMACAIGDTREANDERIRNWSEGKDDGSVHCLGNGLLCVYEQGPNIIQAFGPPYSTASVLRLAIQTGQDVRSGSVRETGTAIWTHTLSRQEEQVGTLLDFVDTDLPCFVREAHLGKPLTLSFEVDPDVEVVPDEAVKQEGARTTSLLLTSPAGRYLYPRYPMLYAVSYRVIVSGAASIQSSQERKRWEIRLEAGDSWIYVVGGPRFPEVQQNAEAACAIPPDELLKRTRASWEAFTDRRRDFTGAIPESVSERKALLQAIDDVAVIIKTQEARGGGILAGYPYHLLYVRDQYGVSRCLLRLGYAEEAKGILHRDWKIWQRHGCIHNAQAADVDGVFHIHENDDVEITGYLILQAFDYAKTTNDWAFLKEILPMLEWAWNAQQKHLVHDMLPFNGDETYVAGGILPRNTLNDGSAEATLLFITGGKRLLEAIGRKPEVFYLDRPNNPTGQVLPLDDVARLARAAMEKGTWVISDEAYGDFLPDDESAAVLDFPNLVTCRSFSKGPGAAGIRAGFAVIRDAELAALFRKVQPPFVIGALDVRMALEILKDKAFLRETRAYVRMAKTRALDVAWHKRGWSAADTDDRVPIFLLSQESGSLVQRLAAAGISCEGGSGYFGMDDRSVRLRVPAPAQLEAFLERLASA